MTEGASSYYSFVNTEKIGRHRIVWKISGVKEEKKKVRQHASVIKKRVSNLEN